KYVAYYSTCYETPTNRYRKHDSTKCGPRRANATPASTHCSLTGWWNKPPTGGSHCPANTAQTATQETRTRQKPRSSVARYPAKCCAITSATTSSELSTVLLSNCASP